MLGFIVRRLLSAALVITLTSMFVFALFFLGPRNPAQAVCDASGNGNCTPAKLAAIENSMGLNDPVTTAYKEWAVGLVKGRTIDMGTDYQCDAPCLGISYSSRLQVFDELKDKYPATLSIAILGSAIYLSFGVALGVVAARFRGTFTDRALMSTSLVVSAVPYYLIALLAWIYLTQLYSVFPETGYTPLTENPFKWLSGLLLPCLVLGLASSTTYARFSRGQMVETLGEDYIRTATAKGLTQRKVLFKHGLRAAIIPVITIFGLEFGALLGGTVFTEAIFRIDGMGRWAIDAIGNPTDIPVVTATVLVASFFIVLANLAVDLIYSVLDPRVRLS